jgi:endo-1,4-beta-D-glucanase Y
MNDSKNIINENIENNKKEWLLLKKMYISRQSIVIPPNNNKNIEITVPDTYLNIICRIL